jgi:hypothetical protein
MLFLNFVVEARDIIMSLCFLVVLSTVLIKRPRESLTLRGFITLAIAMSASFFFVVAWFYAGFHRTYNAFGKPANLLADAIAEALS